MIDNQVPPQSAYTAKTGRPVGIPTPISAFGALCPVRLDDRPKIWYGHEESNSDLYVRSVPSCPLDDARVKLWQPVLDSNQRLLGQSQESYR